MKSLFYPGYHWKKYSIRLYIFAFIICSIIIIGCAPTPRFIRSDFEQEQIKSIALMPVIDKRNAEDTVQSYKSVSDIEELLSEKIADKNYDVLSPGSVKNIIKDKAINNMSPENLCSILNVDAILFSELFDYSDKFFINHSIKMDFKIFNAKGDSLWTNNLDDLDRPYLSALGTSAGWAIGVVIDNKISSENKLLTILAGVAAAELVYIIVDGIRDETSQSIEDVFKALPDRKGSDIGMAK